MDMKYSTYMTLNYYEVFYYVAINQNITLTAKKLNISQPSISRSISLLESELKQQLFIRTKNGVTLTKSGEILFEYISHGINWIKRGELELNKASALDSVLTLGASQLSIKTILPDILSQYEIMYPNVNLILQTNSSIKILEDLKENLIDIAVIPDPICHDPDIETLRLQSFNSSLIAGLKYKYLEDKLLSLSELNDIPFITLSHGTAGRRWTEDFYSRNSTILYPSIEVQTSDIIPFLVKSNLGLGIVADTLIKEELEKGAIIKLKLKEVIPKRSFLLCFNKNKKHSLTTKNFINLIYGIFS